MDPNTKYANELLHLTRENFLKLKVKFNENFH